MFEAKLFRPRNCYYGSIGDYPWTLIEALSKIKEISVELMNGNEADIFMIDAFPEKAVEVLKKLSDCYQKISKEKGIRAPKLAYEFWNY